MLRCGVFRARPALSKTTHVESESDALSRGGIRLAVESGGEAVHRIRGAFFGPGFPPRLPRSRDPPMFHQTDRARDLGGFVWSPHPWGRPCIE